MRCGCYYIGNYDEKYVYFDFNSLNWEQNNCQNQNFHYWLDTSPSIWNAVGNQTENHMQTIRILDGVREWHSREETIHKNNKNNKYVKKWEVNTMYKKQNQRKSDEDLKGN